MERIGTNAKESPLFSSFEWLPWERDAYHLPRNSALYRPRRQHLMHCRWHVSGRKVSAGTDTYFIFTGGDNKYYRSQKMYKTKVIETTDGDSSEKRSTSVVTKTTEKTGGVRTTTTTYRSVTKDGIDSALSKLQVDPEKFRSGGTTVTKTIVYTDSSGKREVIEETVENYGDPDKLAKELKNGKGLAEEFKNASAKEASKMGACFGKQRGQSSPSKESGGKTCAPKVDSGKFEDDCLKSHNDYRKKHGVDKLVLSKEMCAYSKEWADHLASTDSFKHRTQDKKYGENIFMKWSSDPNHMITANEPVDSWYSEIKDHVFGKEPTSLKSGHFTQVIWKESKSLGVAWARSKSGKILVVANYDPAGNFIGKFSQNVPPPKK